MAKLRATGEELSVGEYEVQVGIEWSGHQDLIIETVDQHDDVWEDGFRSIPSPVSFPLS